MGKFDYMADYINGNDTLVISCRNCDLRNKYQMTHFSMIFCKLGHETMDIVNTYSLNKIPDPNVYKTIILDGLIFFSFQRNHYDIKDLDIFMDKFKGRVILKTLDIHEWTFCMTNEYRRNFKYIQHETQDKIMMKELFERYRVSDMTFYYYCPESITWHEYFSDVISRFFIIPHVIYKDDIPDPNNINKIHDVLLFGSDNFKLYPFRGRLNDICKNMGLKSKTISRKKNTKYGCMLYREISRSWLTIATYSEEYGYNVQKYFEIPASSSVILGNMTKQGYDIIGDNYIHIDNDMSDDQIKEIIRNALNNKDKLLQMARKGYDMMKDRTYEKYMKEFDTILTNPYNNQFEFSKVSEQLEKHNHLKF